MCGVVIANMLDQSPNIIFVFKGGVEQFRTVLLWEKASVEVMGMISLNQVGGSSLVVDL